jgi:hypothetical protein
MNVDAAIDYPSGEKGWFSKLITGGLMLLGSVFVLPAFIFLGYLLEIKRGVIAGRDTDLPEWTALGHRLKDGFMLWSVLILYGIPSLLILFGLLASLISLQGIPRTVLAVTFGLLAMLYCFFIFIMIIPVMVIVSWTRSPSAALKPANGLAMIRADRRGYMRLALSGIYFWFIAGLGLFICLVGFFITMPWASYAFSNLIGQWGKERIADNSIPVY